LRKHFFIIAFILLSVISGFGQRTKTSNEIGLFLGGCYYIGDLNPNGHFNQFTKPALGLVFRHNFNPRFAWRANAIYGHYEAHDSYSKSAWQRQRNLSVRSQIIEVSVQGEFNFQNFELGSDKSKLSPYIFMGLGAFYFNPQGEYEGEWDDLRPLCTEGQGLAGGSSKNKYRRLQISVPFGVGVKTMFSKGIGIGFEWGMRKTFTDYLDDVSKRYYDPQALLIANGKEAAYMSDPSIGTDPLYTNVGKERGNRTTKDWYNFFGIVLTIKINKGADLCPVAY
jgi:hypothetical protein